MGFRFNGDRLLPKPNERQKNQRNSKISVIPLIVGSKNSKRDGFLDGHLTPSLHHQSERLSGAHFNI